MQTNAIKWCLLLLAICTAHALHAQDVYMMEYARKKPYEYPIVFITTSDSTMIQRISFNVYYNNNKGIWRISRHAAKINMTYVTNADGNIVHKDGHKVFPIYYTAEWLREHRDNTGFYDLLHPNYLALSNKEKLALMEELAKKYAGGTKRKSSR